jgi:hypothetical protein
MCSSSIPSVRVVASTEHGGVTDEGTWATGQFALHDAARLGRVDLLIILLNAHLEQVLFWHALSVLW